MKKTETVRRTDGYLKGGKAEGVGEELRYLKSIRLVMHSVIIYLHLLGKPVRYHLHDFSVKFNQDHSNLI